MTDRNQTITVNRCIFGVEKVKSDTLLYIQTLGSGVFINLARKNQVYRNQESLAYFILSNILWTPVDT